MTKKHHYVVVLWRSKPDRSGRVVDTHAITTKSLKYAKREAYRIAGLYYCPTDISLFKTTLRSAQNRLYRGQEPTGKLWIKWWNFQTQSHPTRWIEVSR